MPRRPSQARSIVDSLRLATRGPSARVVTGTLNAEYEAFLEDRIQEFKDSLPLRELLVLGDEAIKDSAAQRELTEVLLKERIDELIKRRLRLPSFARWKQRHLALRADQNQPSHWGLSQSDPEVQFLRTMPAWREITVIYAQDGAVPLFAAALGARVLVLDPDIAVVYGLENRAVSEALGAHLECEVTGHPWQSVTDSAAVIANHAIDSVTPRLLRDLAAAVQSAPAEATHLHVLRRSTKDSAERLAKRYSRGWHVVISHAHSAVLATTRATYADAWRRVTPPN